MSLTKYLNAKTCWNYLNGVANVYKPAGNKLNQVRSSVLSNIIRGKFFVYPKIHFKNYLN